MVYACWTAFRVMDSHGVPAPSDVVQALYAHLWARLAEQAGFQAMVALENTEQDICFVLSQWASEPEAETGAAALATVLHEQQYAPLRVPPMTQVLRMYDLPPPARS